MKRPFFWRGVPVLVWSLVVSSVCFSHPNTGVFDPYTFGAKGDGHTNDTKAIQAAIDNCHRAGGGKVILHSGCFVSGTLYLKSRVALMVEAGAVLRASDNLDDFPITPSKYPSYRGTLETNKMLIYAEDANDISIGGRGTIDGNGDYWVKGPYGSPSFSKRPRIIHFRGCQNVRVSDVTLYNSASWVQSYQLCRNVVIDGITVDSRENKDIEKERYADVPGRNTDGLDLVDCQGVRISNCYINCGDDAICLKSLSPDAACRDIAITNCVISSNSSGVKIGTETSGRVEDITVQNCVIYDTRGDAISIISVDGARVERINISNITARNIKGCAIFVRLGGRNRTYRENARINTPHLKDVLIENFQGTRIAGAIIAGLANSPVENVVLRNINVAFEGGEKAELSWRDIPEHVQRYPNGKIFGTLPAYGFYIRHARHVTLDNVHFRFINDDERPAVLCDDVAYLDIRSLKAGATLQTAELIRLVNTRDALIAECRPTAPVAAFLSVYGEQSADIVLLNNLLRQARRSVIFEKPSMQSILTEVAFK
ncbi:MAG: glycoside hydrolase family 28 protein [Phycisphaerae bacterium]|nr:glycoside hydrolase family 28 protein [Phycisphaerae bacterium]